MTRPHSDKVGSSTSAQAAGATDAERDEARVCAALQAAGPEGMTDEEIATLLDLSGNTARPRRIALLDRGEVRWSGRTRLTERGRAANVWIHAPRPDWEREQERRLEPVVCSTCRGRGHVGYQDSQEREVIWIEVLARPDGPLGLGVRPRRGNLIGEVAIPQDAASLFAWIDLMGNLAALGGFVLGWWAPKDKAARLAVGRLDPGVVRVLHRLPRG